MRKSSRFVQSGSSGNNILVCNFNSPFHNNSNNNKTVMYINTVILISMIALWKMTNATVFYLFF